MIKWGFMTHTDHYSAILCRKLLNLVLSLSPDLLIEFKNISERLFESSCLHRSHMHIYHCSLKNYFFTTDFDTCSPTLLLLIAISMCNYMYILYIHDYMYIYTYNKECKSRGRHVRQEE